MAPPRKDAPPATEAQLEQYFADMAPLLNVEAPPDVAAIGEIQAKYGLSMDRDSIETLSERFGLSPPQ